MEYEINIKFINATRELIMLYLNNCQLCQKREVQLKRGLVVKPIMSSEMNSHSQINWMQAQPDDDKINFTQTINTKTC